MRVAIHQPEHMPWLGFFHKMASADVLVLLDTVQFSKGDVQNRNRILGVNGIQWLTVPVEKHSWHKLIKDVKVSGDWRGKNWRTLEHAYGRHPHWQPVADCIGYPFLEHEYEGLSDLNTVLILRMAAVFGISTPTLRASELPVDIALSRDEYNAELVLAAGGTQYLAGPKALEYQDNAVFESRGLSVEPIRYVPKPYQQHDRETFTPALSAVDFLMNNGFGSCHKI